MKNMFLEMIDYVEQQIPQSLFWCKWARKATKCNKMDLYTYLEFKRKIENMTITDGMRQN